jgi:hypothetical protein
LGHLTLYRLPIVRYFRISGSGMSRSTQAAQAKLGRTCVYMVVEYRKVKWEAIMYAAGNNVDNIISTD